MIGKIMEWLAEIEEEGLGDEKYVPEDVVAVISKLEIDGTGKSVLVGVFQGVKPVPGISVYKGKVIYWGRWEITPTRVGCVAPDAGPIPFYSECFHVIERQ
jgi:hypothetical protein